MTALRKVSTNSRSSGGHSNIRKRPALASAKTTRGTNSPSSLIGRSAVSPSTPAAALPVPSQRLNSRSAPAPTATRTARMATTVPGRPPWMSRAAIALAAASSCGSRDTALRRPLMRFLSAASPASIPEAKSSAGCASAAAAGCASSHDFTAGSLRSSSSCSTFAGGFTAVGLACGPLQMPQKSQAAKRQRIQLRAP